MPLDTDNSRRLASYIADHPDCKTRRFEFLELWGKKQTIEIVSLPTNLLRYNIRNGRFAAEYRELKTKLDRELDLSDLNDVQEIKRLLIGQNPSATEILKEDLVKMGQKRPGVVTFDGAVINGNRRMAIFDELLKETGDNKWAYMDFIVLPPGTDEADIWRIEAGQQFSKDERLDYGPINRFLKFREGVEHGLTPKEIATTLFGGFTEEDIKEDLKKLDLIDGYLEYLGKPGQYTSANRIAEHMEDLKDVIQAEVKRGSSAIETAEVTQFAYEVIRNDVSHNDIRNFKKILKHDHVRQKLLSEINTNSEISSVLNRTVNPSTGSMELPPKPQLEESPAVQVFRSSIDAATAIEESGKPALLLQKALTNLQNVNLNTISGNDAQIQALVADVQKAFDPIKKAVLGP